MGHDFMKNQNGKGGDTDPTPIGNQFRIVISGMPDVRKILEEMEIDLSLNAEANIDERTKST